MKALLYMLIGAGLYYAYSKHQAATETADLLAQTTFTQNPDGSYTLKFPDGSTASVDQAAVSWIQSLAPSTVPTATSTAVTALTSQIAAVVSPTTAPATTTAPMAALTVRRRGKPVAQPIYLPPASLRH